MKYRHILVALELAEECDVLLERAKNIAESNGARVSLIHIDSLHGEIYPEVVDILATQDNLPFNAATVDKLHSVAQQFEGPVAHLFMGTGDLSGKLEPVINDSGVDLLICGHHHDFWSRLISYSKQLINASPVDILVVPIK
ncbi:universal stress protein [Vibrio sp. SCSIO 43136]|uniref:universal stress protein n=1 Tax=Vibrio sp. SCSIO 43136 TaxID=2819101 RepID=UPI002075A2CB|nr:universal stress protein [Vibrio sp. SCSIO 43136]USD67412.1 universal stress protein [Vibrio sp. SCSIO 43136]